MYKIALNAGHYYGTPGKRCLSSIDPAQTREWVLNNRICDRVEELLCGYDDYRLLRIDDTLGQTDIPVSRRARKANEFGADLYVSVHHNAGLGGKSGGGIIAYTYTSVDDATRRAQSVLYDKLIEKTGLRGNRATPLATADFAECRETAMPAVLLECGFMDSADDTPIILSDDFAYKAAEAIAEGIALLGGLKMKAAAAVVNPPAAGLYYVQTGAFSDYKNAQAMAERLKSAGFDAIIKN